MFYCKSMNLIGALVVYCLIKKCAECEFQHCYVPILGVD